MQAAGGQVRGKKENFQTQNAQLQTIDCSVMAFKFAKLASKGPCERDSLDFYLFGKKKVHLQTNVSNKSLFLHLL